MKIGILGAGGIAARMALTVQGLKDVENYAVASRDLSKAQAFAKQWNVTKAYGCYEDMLADPKVDLIYIAVPHSHHHRWTIAALNAGKNVLCEKAFAANAKQAVEMTALAEEIEGAIADGCEIVEMHSPVRVEKDENGHVAALWVKPQIVGPIEWGRPKPVNAKADEIRMKCDLLLVAVGQGIESRQFEEAGIPVKRGRISALDTSNVKDLDGIFAGGDCVTGPATVIRAIAAGKVAAANIDEYLGFRHILPDDVELPNVRFDDHIPRGRVNMKERPACERRCDFNLMELPMTDEEAFQESGRCLRCDHFGYGIFKGGRVGEW